MTVKILLPAYGKRGSSIIAVNGELRVIDPPKPVCHGYINGCVCEDCTTRAKAAELKREREDGNISLEPAVCACDVPMVDLDEHRCIRCGHRALERAAA
jgi:hypothetical protein